MFITLAFTGIIVGILFLIMAVGVIIGKTSLKGSCGGSGSCDICSKDEGKECRDKDALKPYRLLTRYLPFSRQ